MKNIETCEALWRDSIVWQCVYAMLLGVLAMCIVHASVISPKRDRIDALVKDIERLEQMRQPSREVIMQSVVPLPSACAWKKNEHVWQMTGHFSTVYDCLLQEANERAVASVQLQKHLMGVSIVLGFDGMPA